MNQPINFSRSMPLSKLHDRAEFDCEVEHLNEYLKKYAFQNQKKDAARTYVVTIDGNKIVGFYTLAFGSVSHEEATEEVSQGLGKYSIPVILLARLAVDKTQKGKGLGKALLKDALIRAIQAADIAGLRAFLIHAKDENAMNFYRKFGFISSPRNELELFRKISDIRASLSD
jgi:GNAT superfamily N-acetyltransferase